MKTSNIRYTAFVNHIAIVVALILATLIMSCSKSEKTEKQDAQLIYERSQIENIKTKYSTINYDRPASNLLRGDSLRFSFQLEHALVDTDSRPVLFLAEINDIAKADTGFIITLSSHYDSPFPGTVHFKLACDSALCKQIAAVKDYGFGSGLVAVARIRSITKVAFALESECEDLGDNDLYSTINVNLSDHFLAKGIMLDAVYISNLYAY